MNIKHVMLEAKIINDKEKLLCFLNERCDALYNEVFGELELRIFKCDKNFVVAMVRNYELFLDLYFLSDINTSFINELTSILGKTNIVFHYIERRI